MRSLTTRQRRDPVRRITSYKNGIMIVVGPDRGGVKLDEKDPRYRAPMQLEEACLYPLHLPILPKKVGFIDEIAV